MNMAQNHSIPPQAAGTLPGRPAVGPIPPEWNRRLERELEEGEVLLWVGQPDATMAAVRHLFHIAKIMAALLVFEVFLVLLCLNEIRQGNPAWLFLFVLLTAALVILPLLALWQRRQARRSCYAVTNRRALVYLPSVFGSLNLVTYLPEQLERMTFEQSRLFGPDAGDVVFAKQTRTKTVTTKTTQGPPQPTRVEVFKSVKKFGFLMLRDARRVENLIEEQVLVPRRNAVRLRRS